MIPSFPHGASIDSLTVASARLNGLTSLQTARDRFYGKRVGVHQNAYGRLAGVLSARMLGEAVPPEELLRSHSAWPVFSCLMPQAAATRWMQEAIGGLPSITLRQFRERNERLFSHSWSCCDACVQEHEEAYGVGHWLVVHQLPGVTECPYHRTLLRNACRGCGASLGSSRQFNLPSDPCGECGSSKRSTQGLAASEGSQALGQLYVSLLCGAHLDMSSPIRKRLAEEVASAQATRVKVDSLQADFLSTFRAKSVQALASMLGTPFQDRHVDRAIRGSLPCPAVLQLAVCSYFLAKLGTALAPLTEALTERRSEDPTLLRIYEIADEQGLAYEAVDGRLQGMSASELEAAGIVSLPRWHAFCKQLPEECRAFLKRHGVATAKASKGPVLLRRGMSADEKMAACRARILEVFQPGMRRSELFANRARVAVCWSVKHDKQWLDSVCPKSRKDRL